MRIPRGIAFALMFPVIFASKCKDKKEEPDLTTTEVEAPAAPEVRVQVVSVEPDRVEPGQPFRALVFGSAFQDGARAWVGDVEVAGVTVRGENTLSLSVPPLGEGPHDVRVTNPDGESATLRAGLIARPNRLSATAGLDCDAIVVPFDFDSSAVNPKAAESLTKSLPCFQGAGGRVRIEGHSDDRGTTEYNLALGQRRAQAIEHWLGANGVPPSRLHTVSFGEERPSNPGHDEAAWSENRRGEIGVGQ